MLTIIKVFFMLFLLCLWEYGTLWEFSKQTSKFFFQLSVQVYYLLCKLKRRGKPLLDGAKRGAALWYYPQEHLVVIRDEKVSRFVKFERIILLLCFLLDLTNKHCRTWSSMINLWIYSWKYNIRRNVNSDSNLTMRRVAVMFFELRVVKNFMQTHFNG